MNFFWSTGILKPELIILQKKLVFAHHLANLNPDSLGHMFYVRQEANPEIPSLLSEIQDLELDFHQNKNLSKRSWKKKVKGYIHDLCKAMPLQEIKGYKKISYEECSKEEFERKSYFRTLNLEQTRDRYRISSSMVKDIRGNFPSKYRGESLRCQSCKNNSMSNRDLDETTE